MKLSAERPPLVLIACSDDWMSRALESVFQQHGYVVVHTRSGSQAIELARLTNHDLLVLDESLADMGALEVSRKLRDGTQYDHSVPVVITSSTPPDPRARHAAYVAGAWEYCYHPVDLEPIFVKLETFLKARHELVVARTEEFVNATTDMKRSENEWVTDTHAAAVEFDVGGGSSEPRKLTNDPIKEGWFGEDTKRYEALPYSAQEQLDVYGAKYMNDNPTGVPPVELGIRLYDRGAYTPRPTWLGAKDPIGFSFMSYGDLRLVG